MTILVAIAAVALVAAILALGVTMLITRLYRKVEQGQAMVVNKTRTIEVTFSGALIVPVVHKAELMDISVKRLRIRREGREGLICRDNIRADIDVSFYVRVNPAAESVLDVAKLIGCAEASNPEKMSELFSAKFSEALKTVGKQMDFVELYDRRDDFRMRVIHVIGEDLNGYLLDDVAIEFLEQTALSMMDPNNILDAEGIRKITEITTTHAVVTNELSRDAEKKTKAKDVETTQAIFELDRQEKAAEYRANREMATTKAKEEATTAEVEAQERLRAESARLASDEALGVRDQDRQRQIDVASMNRERVVAVEAERVTEARDLQIIARQVQTTAQTKDLETAKAATARLAKDRVAVEKDVAVEEEAVLTVRVVEEANRQKAAVVTAAAAEAEAGQIAEIKAAEALERAAVHKAAERITLAEADQTAAEREAAAAIRRAEGNKATAAAEGLAQVAVRLADADAAEKTGLATVKVKQADVEAERSLGLARAETARAEGMAEAETAEALLKGQAAGLTEKAIAMAKLEGVGQDYDQFVKQLEADTQVRLAQVTSQTEVGKAQADAMAAALAAANIDIVGGTDDFISQVIGATSRAKVIDTTVAKSATISAIAEPYTSGDSDLLRLVGATIGGLGTNGIKDLTLAGLFTRLSGFVGGEQATLLGQVVDALDEKGLGDLDISSILRPSSNGAAA